MSLGDHFAAPLPLYIHSVNKVYQQEPNEERTPGEFGLSAFEGFFQFCYDLFLLRQGHIHRIYLQKLTVLFRLS